MLNVYGGMEGEDDTEHIWGEATGIVVFVCDRRGLGARLGADKDVE